MENQNFICKIKCDRLDERGMMKSVTEQYLVEAVSFTEAEKRIYEEIAPSISGEFDIKDISRSNINEKFLNNVGDIYYKVKCNFITVDEKTAKEKKTPHYYLINSCDIEGARVQFLNEMLHIMADYVIESIVETKILDVYVYAENESDNDVDKDDKDGDDA
jgi:hypothetical protein